MTKLLSKALPLALATLLAACTGDGSDSGSGFAELAGTFDGIPISSDAEGATAGAEAILQGDGFLDVTITLRLNGRYGAVIVIENPTTTPVGTTLAVGGTDGVTATVFHDDQAPRAAGGTARFDVIEAVAGGTVAGEFDLSFAGGSLSGSFETIVE